MIVKDENQGIATGSNTSIDFSEFRARHAEKDKVKSDNNEGEKFYEKYIPRYVLVEMEEIYKQLNEISQKAIVFIKEICEHIKKIPKPTLAFLTSVGLISLYIISMILSAIYFPVTDIICNVTPYSNSVFSFCKSPIPNFTAMVEAQVEAQEQLLRQSAELYSEGSLARDIKKAELATKDLMLTVKYSNLQFKSILTEKLKEFAEASFEANSDLQTLQVRAQSSLDNTLTYISFTLRAVEEFNGKVISPRQEKDLNKLYDSLMKLTDDDLRKLIYDTDQTLKTLKKLDVIQRTIHDISTQEENLQTIEREQLLSSLWSILGGNRVEKSIFENNLELLRNLENQRKIAVKKISSIMGYLEKFQKQLNFLREETVTRLLTDINVEVHLTNIKKALMRLQRNEVAAGVNIKKLNTASGAGRNQRTSRIY